MQYCSMPHCSTLVLRGRCAKHQVIREQLRPNQHVRRWYHSLRWATLRARVLAAHRVCRELVWDPTRQQSVMCGRPTVDVDHRTPHAGDAARFWNPLNLQALCHECHARKTARERAT
jgi:5-methylcytosine-specific restriction protein A